MKVSLRHGQKYRAVIELGFIERIARNSAIEARLRGAGFADVVVTGSGSIRAAVGRWTGLDTTTDLPSQIKSVVEAI